MPERIPQSATLRVQFPAYLSSDHISNATGKTIAITISKNGGAFGNPSAGATNATEVASGDYYVDLSTTDTGTLGPLVVRGAAGTIDDVKVYLNVVKATNAGFSALPDAAAEAAGGLYTRGTGAGQINQPANGQIDANAKALGGTTLTGRDIGASVLLSTGTGTGQLDFTSGVVKANLAQILGTALTETAGLLAGGFKKFFNVSTPTGTVNSIPDAVAGASGGVSIVGSAMTLTSGERNSVADAHLDKTDGVETSLTVRQSLRLILASAAGKLSGAATTTVTIRNVGDSKDRITATVDANGNRSAVTTDGT